MAFTLDPQTGKIIFGVVADLTHDAIAIDLASQFGVSETFKDNFAVNDPTVEDNFTSDNFTNINGARVAVNTGTQVMDWVSSGATLYNDGEFRDILGQTIDASNWTIRFKLTVSSSSTGADGTANSLFVGFSDDNTSLAGTVQDFAGFQIFRQATGNTGAFRLMTTDGTAPNVSAGTDTTLIPTVDTYFVEFIRNGSTITGNIYSDASFNVLTESVSQAIGAGVTGLRHLKVMVSNRDGTGDHTFAGTIDDVQFFNGEATLTNWTSTDATNIAIANGVVDWTVIRDGTNNALYLDLGAGNVSDTSWILRFKLSVKELNDGTNVTGFIGISDLDGTTDYAGPKDFLGMFFTQGTSTKEIGSVDINDGNMQGGQNTALSTALSVTDFYVEIVRTTATTMDVRLFSDANYTTLIEEDTSIAISSSIADLRFILLQGITSPSTTATAVVEVDDIQFWNGITVPVITSNAWRLRFTLDIADLNLTSGSDLSMWVGLSDKDETSKSNQLNDAFIMATFVDSIAKTFSFSTSDNQAPRASGSDVIMTTVPTETTFFVEMQRNSETETTVSFYTDSTFTSTLETNTQTGITGTSNLKYFKLFNDEPGNNSNTMDGTLDDITFTQLVSLGVETDKTFTVDALLQVSDNEETFDVDALLQAEQEETFDIDAIIKSLGDNSSCISTYTDDFSSDRFVDNDATFISVGTGRMNFDAQTDNTNDASASDISLVGRFGSVLPSTWRIRFEINFTSFGTGNNNHMMFSIGDEDQLTNSETGFGSDEMSIGFHALTGVAPDSNKRMTGYHKDGDTQINTASIIDGGSVTMTGTKFYQIERTSDTSVTYSIFSDAGFTTLLGSITQTIPNLTGMQYFKVSNFKFDNSGEGAIIGRVDNLEILGLNPLGTVACPQLDALLQAEQTETFEVDAFVKSLGDNGSCTNNYSDDMLLQSDWISTDTTAPSFNRINESTEKWEWSPDPAGVNSTQAQDISTVGRLGSNLPDNGGWRVRFTLDLTSFTNGNSNHQFFGMRNVNQTLNHGATSSLQKSILIRITSTLAGTGPAVFWQTRNGNNGTTLGKGSFGTEVLTVAGGVIGCQIERTSSTSATVGLYTDGTFTTLIQEITSTIDSGITDLQFFGGGNFAFSQSGEGQFGGLTDDLEITVFGAIGSVGCAQVDAIILVKTIDETFDVDSILKIIVDEDFVVDAFPQATQTFNFTVDGLLFITPSELICVDAFLQDTFDEDFTVDGRLAVRETFEADARLVNRFDEDFTVDAFAQATFDEDYAVDGRLIVRKTTTFDIDGFTQAKPQIPFEFEIDAVIRYAQGSAVDQFGAIPDLIIRVLRENVTLTGRGIVDEIVIITTAENFPFRGKNSRIKNWLNRLRLDGLTQEDGSSPDWYKTIWSLV